MITYIHYNYKHMRLHFITKTIQCMNVSRSSIYAFVIYSCFVYLFNLAKQRDPSYRYAL